jgi:uncharacterized membrane protein YcjF (UPF0283 family)
MEKKTMLVHDRWKQRAVDCCACSRVAVSALIDFALCGRIVLGVQKLCECWWRTADRRDERHLPQADSTFAATRHCDAERQPNAKIKQKAKQLQSAASRINDLSTRRYRIATTATAHAMER